ncbi:hypothetical protein [Actinomadura sp. SCN-SB]|uniref:hypothetical protein n=1 Tax=Actinomadura sp. SCN-SB TaxID=3373092 RepID=UPI003752D23F
MRATDDDGRELDAEYAVEIEPGSELLSLVLESSSGASTKRAARNTEYRPALRLLLERLKQRGAVLQAGLLDSRSTRSMPESDRRLFSEPIRLSDVHDIEELRKRLCNAQTTIGQAEGATKGGNASKRIRLRLTVPGYKASDATRLAADLASPGARETRTVFTAPRSQINRWWDSNPSERFADMKRRTDPGSVLLIACFNANKAWGVQGVEP